MTNLVCVGMGYCARALAWQLADLDWRITGTARSKDGAENLTEAGWRGMVFDGTLASVELAAAIADATHLLLSVPPGAAGDPLLAQHAGSVRAAQRLRWIGYLSTTGVYGDHGGGWIDESTPAMPRSARGQRRLQAEEAWLTLGSDIGKRAQIFRLSGIYGPGRSAIDQLRAGTARRVIKPGQVFNRIHVDDVANVLMQAVSGRGSHTHYNLADDEPAPPEDVVTYAARLLGVPPPAAVAFEEAELSDMARSFYAETKRVRNHRMKQDFDIELLYPTYREGLAAILDP